MTSDAARPLPIPRDSVRPGRSRWVLLSAAVLAGCAAADPAEMAGPPAPVREMPGWSVAGAFGPYLAGRFAASQRDSSAAADSLLAAARAEPDEREVLSRALSAAVVDNRPEAPRLARRVPDQPLAVVLLAVGHAQAGRWDRAEAGLRDLKPSGSRPLPPLLLAWARAGRGDGAAALATLEPGGPHAALVARHAALVADLASDREALAARLPAALSPGESGSARPALLLAGLLARAGRAGEGERLLAAASARNEDEALPLDAAVRRLALSGRAVSSPLEGMAEALLDLGEVSLGQGAHDLALLLSRLAAKLRPDLSEAHLLAAEALDAARRPEAALLALAPVSPHDGAAPLAALRRATLLDRVGRGAEAVALLGEVAARHPASPRPPARLGDVLAGQGRHAEAASAYEAALERLGPGRHGEGHLRYLRGAALERAGRWPEAEAELRRALALAPDQPHLLNHLAYHWVERGERLEEARAMLERAAALRPRDGHVADSLGWALYRLGDLPGALRWLERAVELQPRHPEVNDHLGDVYWAAGRHAEARFQWRRALGLAGQGAESSGLEAKLRDGLPATASAPSAPPGPTAASH